MSEPKDPERLLADALRAQAVFAPHVAANPVDEQAASDASGSGSAVQPGASGTGSFSAAGGPGISGPGAAGTGSFGASAATGAPSQTGPTTELPPNYGLLSGAGADSLARERAALDAADHTSPGATGSIPPAGSADATVRRPAQAPQNGPLPAHWVLLLAVLLGLAAGSVIGLLTLI
ncbi:hypothetical protein CU254_38115 [Amycolatopsis sp. AA4]|uniref:hypothetical protein n=1 Tax=Actinomycetes TaxID=1760 RepID=UPI0001B55149|nr:MULTISPECIES: hypothetical protein [Actinomycetes]ATY15558.1 hypothetical protein CU254_38115 [Amycolatopsis sp. AA4]EFL11835.1 predicted protein [Streptomyces sp. AA4]